MKADDIKIANPTDRQLQCILAATITWLLSALILVVTIESSQGADATWAPDPPDREWGNPNNWVPMTVPNGPNDTATFDLTVSNRRNVFILSNIEVNRIVFTANADIFTIHTDLMLTISGAGITNESGIRQFFETESGGVINFRNSAAAGLPTVRLTIPIGSGGTISFFDTSNADNAVLFANRGSPTNPIGGTISFFDTSTAGNAILGAGAGLLNVPQGAISFHGTSTAGSATLTAFGVDPPQGGVSGGTISFFDTSTAGNATLSVDGGSATGANLSFFGNSNAGNARLSVNGGPTSGFGGGVISFFNNSNANNATLSAFGVVGGGSGGTISFLDTSTAGNATLIANGALGADSGATISFFGSSTGGTSRVEVFGNGNLDISGHNAPGVPVGSIEGNGDVFLGANNLTVGSNNLSTLFSGVIQDGGPSGGTGGSLTKEGTGTLVLSGANTYTGITTINAGVLSISSDANLGIAPSPTPVADQLTFNGGTLQTTDSFDLDTNRGITLLSQGGTIGVTNDSVLSYGGVITGTGSLTKADTGTLVLSGVNRYMGATTVNAGILTAGAINTLPSQTALTVATDATFDLNNFSQSIGSLAGAGNVTLGTATLTTGNDNTSTDFSGIISGGGNPLLGALVKVGTGTQTLSGQNTYTGPTMVDAGTLLVDGFLAEASAVTVNSGATLGGTGTAAGAVTIADGSILAPGHNGPGTFTVGSLSLGNASLLNYDLGTPGVIDSQVNDLTIVRRNLTLDGVLNTTALAGFGPGAYRLFNYGGALTDNTLDIGTVPAGFSASNFIVVTGLPNEVDLLVLEGPPQFWDGHHTTPNGHIDGGSGEWDNFTTNWADQNGNNNSSWQNGTAVFAGTAGIVTVTRPIFFAGMEFMTNGYQIDQGVRASLNLIGSPVIDTAFADVTATINATLAGVGGITKKGPGTLILTGANTYTGSTTVDAGALLVDGSLASAQTFVNAGGLLGGSGIIGGDLTNGGTVSPGHSPGSLGTLTVNGNYTQTTGGTLRIEIAGLGPNQHDMLVVNGKATLGGTLQVIPVNNFQFQPGNEITFLTAKGGVSGTFNPLENPFLLISVDQSSIPKTVALEVLAVSAPPPFVSTFNIGVSLANIQTVNLERRMDDIHARRGRGFSSAGLNINGSLPNFSGGLAGPTGPEGKSGPSVMEPTPENRWGVFVMGVGEFTNIGDTSNARGFDLTTGGLTFGADYRVSPNFAIGLTGGYANTNVDLVNNGSLGVNGGTIGAYATGFGGGFYVDVAAFGVFNGYDSHRTALLGTASGDTDGQDFNALALAGYDWKSGGLTIGPLASYQYTYVGFDSFTEHGSVAPLSFSNQNAESSRTALGAKASYDWRAGHVLIRPEIRASWQHEFGDTEYSIVSRLADGAGSSFSVNGPAIGRDSLLIGAGAAVIFNDRVSVYAYYDGELARTNYTSNNVTAGFRVTF
ncbi:MAG: autotransporter domain-containing protein [Chthoniobacterales bacterium]